VRTLTRLFRASLGTGFAEWRRQVQLASAVAGLVQGAPAGRIARSLGYRPSSFSDMFRREPGVTPSACLGASCRPPTRNRPAPESAPAARAIDTPAERIACK
jgi:AraC-like DNA-binding protein